MIAFLSELMRIPAADETANPLSTLQPNPNRFLHFFLPPFVSALFLN